MFKFQSIKYLLHLELTLFSCRGHVVSGWIGLESTENHMLSGVRTVAVVLNLAWKGYLWYPDEFTWVIHGFLNKYLCTGATEFSYHSLKSDKWPHQRSFNALGTWVVCSTWLILEPVAACYVLRKTTSVSKSESSSLICVRL